MKEVRDLQQDKQLWTFSKKRSYKRNKEEAIVKGPGTDVVPDEGSLILSLELQQSSSGDNRRFGGKVFGRWDHDGAISFTFGMLWASCASVL
ncbi:unnamed protein product [Prunus armeniaca]